MPTREAIVDNIIPQQIEKPIPTRTISTRVGPKPMTVAGQDGNHSLINRNNSGADSPKPEESVRLSPQLSALARKEQAYRQREQALKQREKDLEEKLAKADQFESLNSKLSAKDFSEVEKLGLNYEDYVKYKLDAQMDEDPQAQALKALEAEIHALKMGQEENAKSEYEETVHAYRKELTTIAESNPEFLRVKKFKEEGPDGKPVTGVDVALQLILDSWEQDGEEVTIDEALKLTEQSFLERAKKWAELIDEPAPQVDERRLPPPRTGRTLTNQMLPQGETARPQKSLQHLSESERYAEARRRVLAKRQQQGN